MELTIRERLLLLSLFPPESTKLKCIIMEGIQNKVKVSQEEASLIEYKERPLADGTTSCSWNDKKEKTINIELDEVETATIRGFIDQLDKAEDIKPIQMCVVRKFDK